MQKGSQNVAVFLQHSSEKGECVLFGSKKAWIPDTPFSSLSPLVYLITVCQALPREGYDPHPCKAHIKISSKGFSPIMCICIELVKEISKMTTS